MVVDCPAMEWFEKIRAKREEMDISQAQLATMAGVSQSAINKIEQGKVQRSRAAPLLAKALGMPLSEIDPDLAESAGGEINAASPANALKPNASVPSYVDFPAGKVGLFGRAVGGMDGRFILNGQKITDVFCPPSLAGVEGAYAVYVFGDSMEPRYEAGEVVWLHPYSPVRKFNYVVVQLAPKVEGDAPEAYVKQFISRNNAELVLRQLNPPDGADEFMRFPEKSVLSVHKIVFAGHV